MIQRRNRPHIPRNYLYEPYGPGHAIARAIRSGTHWFDAWAFQYALYGARLRKMAGIAPDRAEALRRGAAITRAELDGLAAACGVQAADVIASLPDPTLLAEV